MRSSIPIVTCLALSIGCSNYSEAAEARDAKPTAKVSTDWVGTDRYDRPMAEFAEAGPKRPDKVVGMFYYLWHGQHTPPWGNDVTKYLQEHDGDMRGMSPFPKPNELSKDPWTYYWAEPEDGYYHSKDPWILKKHLRLLSHAGVDFLYFDCTNGWTYLDVVEELCKASMELRAQGLKTPQIAMVVSTGATEAIQTMYNKFYRKGKYEELWFKWEGKPLVLGHRDKAPNEEIANFFTWRKSDAWSGVNEDRWDWINPTGHGWKGTPDTIEQMSVSKGSHATLNVGSSYVITDFNGPHAAGTGYQPPVDKFWLCEDTGKGDYWEAQWDRTLQLDPQVVMITQWNEWVAGCFEWAPGVQASSSFLGKPLELGDRFFVDEFNAEFNRDIEPMKGGYGDAFVYRMLHWVRKFKGMDAPVEVSGPATIPIDGEFSEWKSVQPAYTDFEGDTEHRDFMAYDAMHHYTNTTGRNDIVEMKVAADQKNLFFHVKTDKPLTPPTDPNWMLLFLDTDKDKTTGWEGYDFVVNAEVKDGKTTTLKKWVDGDWRTVESLSYAMKDNQLELAIPLTSLGMKPDAVDFHFKWADNMPDLKDAAGFNSDGDAAPDRGFNFHYTNIPGNPPAGGRQNSAATSPVAAEDLSLANPSFEEECSADSKIGNWLLVSGAGGSAWGRFGGATGGVVASDGGTLLFTNSTAAVVVQLLKEAPIRAGKYVFSMDVNSPVSGSGADLVSARGVQMAVYAIPTASDNEARFTPIAEKSISAAAMGRDEQWKPLEVAFNIPASSPLIGQFFQINIASSAPAPGAPEPAQVNIDNVRAKRLSSSAGPRAATMPAGGRLDATDAGRIIRHGDGPDSSDINGMREPSIVQEDGKFYLFYDGCAADGWLACLATSDDLKTWKKHGRMLSFGPKGADDSGTATSPWLIKDGDWWHMFYVASPNTTPPPELVPASPYLTMKARSKALEGPWEQQRDIVPFRPIPKYGVNASPGHIVKKGDEWLMFFSGAGLPVIARTKDLNGAWTIDPQSVFDEHMDLENISLYHEESNDTWWMFANHIDAAGGYTDAVWVFWTKDIEKWNAKDRAIVLDGSNCSWSKKCVGMGTVTKVGDRLAIFYDAAGGESISHMNRDIGLAWLDLQLVPPAKGSSPLPP